MSVLKHCEVFFLRLDDQTNGIYDLSAGKVKVTQYLLKTITKTEARLTLILFRF